MGTVNNYLGIKYIHVYVYVLAYVFIYSCILNNIQEILEWQTFQESDLWLTIPWH